MIGRVDFNKSMDFWQQDKWNGYFPVKWHIIKDVPNPQLRHIILENNDHKPVTNSRDTQEVHIFSHCNYLPKISKLFLLYTYRCDEYFPFSGAFPARYWNTQHFQKLRIKNIDIRRFWFLRKPSEGDAGEENKATYATYWQYTGSIFHLYLILIPKFSLFTLIPSNPFSTLLMNVCMWWWDQFGITLINA